MLTTKKTISVLIPDAQSKYTMLVLNSLSLAKDVQIHLLSTKRFIAARYSKHLRSFSVYSYSDKEEWIHKIIEIVKDKGIDVVLPIDMDSIPLLNKLHLDVSEIVEIVPLPKSDPFRIASDKWLLAKHLKNHNLPVPTTVLYAYSDDTCDMKFPCLLKPMVDSGGGEGIVKFNSEDALRKYLSDLNIKEPVMLQEYIVGESIGCNVLCKEGEVLASTLQVGCIYDKKPFSPQLGLKFFENEDIRLVIEELMNSLNWNGVANIDMIYNAESGEMKILEINPRFWLSVDASALAGVNFAYQYVCLGMGKPILNPHHRLENYVNLRGLYLLLKKNPRTIFQTKFIWNNTSLRFVIADPLPMCYHFLWRTKNIIVRHYHKWKSKF